MAENIIECSTACTVTVQLEPAPVTEDHIADLSAAWYLFFGAAIVIVAVRKLYDLFDRGPHEG